MTLRVALTGATGFIGSTALRALLGSGAEVRALARTVPAGGKPAPGGMRVPRAEWVHGDLADRASLRELCRGAEALVHLASRVGGPEEDCEAVNSLGTEALMREAVRARIPRIVHLSTAAVYGFGPHRGIAVDGVRPAPVSPASRTRLAGEGFARAAGAVVLRPGLVLGRGDRWVVPAYAELVRRVPAVWDGGTGLLSVVEVGDLARLIATLATAAEPVEPAVHHASHPVPVPVGELLAELARHGVLPVRPEADLPWPTCLRLLGETPGRVSERQFSLLAQDHWYRSEEIWDLADCPAGPGLLARLGASAGWYRDHLALGGEPG
ncbi:NAD(P)-dependent oxidoreductase [Kitasatospora sp. GP82]|uniref:NAD-dependent epimerase/dehydratase family protein n=1 Tax=Kitasatospora sp. GP82 TaxID=3035089 RepID=UPI002475CF2D|nr:NAD(P)-dependent oxidoreductase [Kitasatospora sp. GP82]MDH6129596.1 nucleoside-diphosphate-sugar epimerase [Kitasatospora sp. GP82]